MLDVCPVCARTPAVPVSLSCTHRICLHCAITIYSHELTGRTDHHGKRKIGIFADSLILVPQAICCLVCEQLTLVPAGPSVREFFLSRVFQDKATEQEDGSLSKKQRTTAFVKASSGTSLSEAQKETIRRNKENALKILQKRQSQTQSQSQSQSSPGCSVFSSSQSSQMTIAYEPLSQSVPDAVEEDNEMRSIRFDRREETCIQLAVAGHNLLIFGAAGTGKTYLLQAMAKHLQQFATDERTNDNGVYITAASPSSASMLNTCTVHNLFGFTLTVESEPIADTVAKSKRIAGEVLTRIKVLLIDDLNVVSAALLQKMDAVLRSVAQSMNQNLPFGGVQLLCCADPFALPPPRVDKFKHFFSCRPFISSFTTLVELTGFKRPYSIEYAELLMQIRIGSCSTNGMQQIHKCFRGKQDPNGTNGSRSLVTLCAGDATTRNHNALQQLPTPPTVFRAVDTGRIVSCPAASAELMLKVGSTVRLTVNLSGLRKGSTGTLIGWTSNQFLGQSLDLQSEHRFRWQRWIDTNPNILPVVSFNGSETVIKPVEFSATNGLIRQQIPLKVSFAVTITDSCGSAYEEAVNFDIATAWQCGSIYFALSRCLSFDHVNLLSFDPSKIRVDPQVKSYMASLSFATVEELERLLPTFTTNAAPASPHALAAPQRASDSTPSSPLSVTETDDWLDFSISPELKSNRPKPNPVHDESIAKAVLPQPRRTLFRHESTASSSLSLDYDRQLTEFDSQYVDSDCEPIDPTGSTGLDDEDSQDVFGFNHTAPSQRTS